MPQTSKPRVRTCQDPGIPVRLLAMVLLATVLPATAAERLCEMAEVRNRPPGAPQASDVIMRSLALHPRNDQDPHDTMQALRDFHATTLAWAYVNDPAFLKQVKQSGRVFGGAAAAPSWTGQKTGDDWMQALAILDRRGEVIVAPWKRSWNHPTLWGCMNNPQLESGYREYLKQYVDAGAQIMQRDEPRGNDNAVNWGGCFCDHCTTGFRRYLETHLTDAQRNALGIDSLERFDYRSYLDQAQAPVGDAFRKWDGGLLKELFTAFQKESTVAFHRRTRKAIDDYAGRRIPFSCNNGVRRWDEVELLFDWAFGELAYSHANPRDLYRAMRAATDRDRLQIVTMPKKGDQLHLTEWERRTRQTIATAYACGGHCMVPWDVYMPRDAPRYFGTPEQYADLFGFVRANACYLDGYEQAEAAGCGVPVDQQAAACVIGNGNVLVNVRVIPGKTDAPVVIHLVDWSPQPAPFELVLSPLRFFGDRPLRARLLRPAPYESAAHRAADATQDYAALSQESPLAEGRTVSLQIPALQPWGLVVVEAASEAEVSVWQPTISAEPDSFHAARLKVRIDCASPESVIRYTLDGSCPGEDSPTYQGPFELTSSAEIKAAAYGVSERSRVASASFSQVDGPGLLPSPDAQELSDALKLWLSADALEDQLNDGQAVQRWHANAGPSAVVPAGSLPDGRVPAAPVFRSQSLGGRPVVQFDGADDQLVVPGFANEHLAGSAFTVFLVTQSSAGSFGICGNGLTGSGGAPRLYLTRDTFRYDDLHKGLAPRVPDGATAIATYAHDGRETIRAWVNGEFCGQQDGLPAVAAFGGGNLAMPFWGGNRPQAGEIAEIIVYNRQLREQERRSVEVYLASKYQLPVRRWR